RNAIPVIVLTVVMFCIGLCLPPHLQAQTQTLLTQKEYEEDFDVFWKEIDQSYAYFDKKQTDWSRVRDTYRPLTAHIQSKREFVALLEQALEELYDFHCNLNTNTEASAVLVPTDADLWAEWTNGRAIITEVRADSPASRAGIKAGAEVVSIDG